MMVIDIRYDVCPPPPVATPRPSPRSKAAFASDQSSPDQCNWNTLSRSSLTVRLASWVATGSWPMCTP